MNNKIITIAMALLLVLSLAAACADSTAAGDTAVTPAPAPDPSANTEQIERAYEAYTQFREYFNEEDITALDYTQITLIDGAENLPANHSNTTFIIDADGRNGRSLSELVTGGEVTYYSYEEREGDRLVRQVIYNPETFSVEYDFGEPIRWEIYDDNMTEAWIEGVSAGIEADGTPFDIWVDMTFINFFSRVHLHEFDIGAVQNAETEESDGLTTATLVVDPMGIQQFRDNMSFNVEPDYDGPVPRLNVYYGEHIIFTIVTDSGGTPVSNSMRWELTMEYLGDWGGEVPEMSGQSQAQLLETVYNAFNDDVTLEFDLQPVSGG